MGDTICFLEKNWDTVRSQVTGMSFYDLFDVSRMFGGGRKSQREHEEVPNHVALQDGVGVHEH
jgi:hypothetical protein